MTSYQLFQLTHYGDVLPEQGTPYTPEQLREQEEGRELQEHELDLINQVNEIYE